MDLGNLFQFNRSTWVELSFFVPALNENGTLTKLQTYLLSYHVWSLCNDSKAEPWTTLVFHFNRLEYENHRRKMTKLTKLLKPFWELWIHEQHQIVFVGKTHQQIGNLGNRKLATKFMFKCWTNWCSYWWFNDRCSTAKLSSIKIQRRILVIIVGIDLYSGSK